MRLKVIVTQKGAPHAETQEFRSAYCLVGRKNATLVLEDPRCSQQHVLLFEGPDSRLWLRDLESTNGTYVNGKRAIERAVAVGDSIRIGVSTIVVTEFTPARDNSLTQPNIPKSTPGPEKEETTFVGKRKKHVVDPGLVNRWPDNMMAAPRNFQEKFLDYVDENGETTRVRLKDLLKAA